MIDCIVAKAYPRIDGIVAVEANIAALIRRGPSRWVCFYVWDLNDDRIIIGDWLEGHVYSRRGDISPDGRRVPLTMKSLTNL